MKKEITKEIHIERKWVKVESGRSFSRDKDLTISFGKIKPNGSCPCVIRIGNVILEKMGWKIGDKIDIFHDEHYSYEWMISKSSTGYSLHSEQGKCHYLKIGFTWKKDGIPYYGLKEAKFKCKKDQIELTVPV